MLSWLLIHILIHLHVVALFVCLFVFPYPSARDVVRVLILMG